MYLRSYVGADSRVGLVASTVMGSSETIFYTVCVYMSAIDRKSTGYAVPCSLVGALAGTVLAGAYRPTSSQREPRQVKSGAGAAGTWPGSFSVRQVGRSGRHRYRPAIIKDRKR